ncbi:nucleotidyltransferase domain-containing protein [Oribacterium sp. NK2B42]|uniref:nucleotidyltransferase domain-containing protein n=1 Tax=Oribacterium sp. NK2B42 TaxID=689781 RepID=UPI0003FF8E9B|nr:nucleotidyltransferase domain-containing protein [Oribacterium sp. NK2B42]
MSLSQYSFYNPIFIIVGRKICSGIKDWFVDEVKSIYGNNLKSIILYGSVARGTADEDSDVDIAMIIVNEDEAMYDKLLDII